MQISNAGILLIERFEGLRLTRYLDSVGVPTIGFGTTAGDLGHPVPETCTLTQAEQWLRDGMARTYAAPINRLVAGGLQLTQNEYDALCSLSYNVGPGVISDVAAYSMARDLSKHDLTAASGDFMHYVFAGGQVLQGLVTRRRAERALFDTKPAPPPDPHHYRWFDAMVRDLGQERKGSEQAIVIEYDRKRAHWLRFPGRLKTLRADLDVLVGRLDAVMESDPSGNEPNHRSWRRDQLAGRAAGRRYV